MKTVIRKYDETRVAILPLDGVPQEIAEFLESTAQRQKWGDFKIVVRQNDKKLGIVCKPKRWLELIGQLKIGGGQLPVNYEIEFLEAVSQVMKKGGAITIAKPLDQLSSQERDILEESVRKVHEES